VPYTLLKNEKIDNAAKTRTVLYDFEETKKSKTALGQALPPFEKNTASPTAEDFTVTRYIGGTFTIALGLTNYTTLKIHRFERYLSSKFTL